ncbi:MAG: ROK family protein [Rhodobacteraceae bacterium]|nr:ROK family protein [Paracoccaceae bacterium]
MSFDPSNEQSFTFPVLVADIGGTNARLALVHGENEKTDVFGVPKTTEHPDISSAIRQHLPADCHPKTAIIAVAGPVTGDAIALTNADWVIEPKKMITDLGLEQVIILNDFEAQALALPVLSGTDVTQIGSGSILDGYSKFVIGPGTGLGAAAMVRAANTWIPVPGEGGHVEVGPVHPDDFEIFPHVERTGGRLSAEMIVSGTGLPRLARGVALAMKQERTFKTASEITEAAKQQDPVGVKTLETFARALGRISGDFALTVLARGGVYIAGGVTQHVAAFLTEACFRKSFETKAPHEALMKTIPTFIVTHPNPALEGLAAFARRPDDFAVQLTGRNWTV